MFALAQTAHAGRLQWASAFRGKPDIRATVRNVCSWPKADIGHFWPCRSCCDRTRKHKRSWNFEPRPDFEGGDQTYARGFYSLCGDTHA